MALLVATEADTVVPGVSCLQDHSGEQLSTEQVVEEVPAALALTASDTAHWALSMTIRALVRGLHTHTECWLRHQATRPLSVLYGS